MPPRNRRKGGLLVVLVVVSAMMVMSFIMVGSALPSGDGGPHGQHDREHEKDHENERNSTNATAKRWGKWPASRRGTMDKPSLKEWIAAAVHPRKVSVLLPAETWRVTYESLRQPEKYHFLILVQEGKESLGPFESLQTVPVKSLGLGDILTACGDKIREYFIVGWDGVRFEGSVIEAMVKVNGNVTGCGLVNPRGEILSHGMAIAEGNKEPVFVHRYAGYNRYDSRATHFTYAPSADHHCILLKTSYARQFEDPNHHTMALTEETQVGIVGTMMGFAVLDDSVRFPADVSFSSLSKPFRAAWGEKVSSRYLRKELNVVWDTFCVKCFGFTNEVMHFVEPLEGLVGVKLEQGENCFCLGTPVSFSAALRRVHKDKAWMTDFKNKKDWEGEEGGRLVVWVSHKDPGSISKPRKMGRRPDWVVGRSMYEFTKIDPGWIPNANDDALLDEIWVPSTFVWSVFSMNGIKKDKLTIVPEPVDVHFYDPKTTPHTPLPNRNWTSTSNRPTTSPTTLQSNYKFLSVFKLEPRKGWDILLSAYLHAFTRDDPVSLYLVCYMWGVSDARNPKTVMSTIQAKAAELGYPLESQPHIEVITQELTEKQMASMYRSADAFVLPTKGEGWGLPIIQAMAMGMPAVATNWSGNVDFMKADNSFFIRVEKLEELPADSMYGASKGKVWAVPSTTHLTEILKDLQANPQKGLEVGARARRHVVENYSDEVIARVVVERLKAIKEVVAQRRKTRKGGDEKDGKSLTVFKKHELQLHRK